MQAMSLADSEADSEQNELRTLQTQLHRTNMLVATLSTQLQELREQVAPPTESLHRIRCNVSVSYTHLTLPTNREV